MYESILIVYCYIMIAAQRVSEYLLLLAKLAMSYRLDAQAKYLSQVCVCVYTDACGYLPNSSTNNENKGRILMIYSVCILLDGNVTFISCLVYTTQKLLKYVLESNYSKFFFNDIFSSIISERFLSFRQLFYNFGTTGNLPILDTLFTSKMNTGHLKILLLQIFLH